MHLTVYPSQNLSHHPLPDVLHSYSRVMSSISCKCQSVSPWSLNIDLDWSVLCQEEILSDVCYAASWIYGPWLRRRGNLVLALVRKVVKYLYPHWGSHRKGWKRANEIGTLLSDLCSVSSLILICVLSLILQCWSTAGHAMAPKSQEAKNQKLYEGLWLGCWL